MSKNGVYAAHAQSPPSSGATDNLQNIAHQGDRSSIAATYFCEPQSPQIMNHSVQYVNVHQLASPEPKELIPQRSFLNSINSDDGKKHDRFMSITTAASPTSTIKMSLDGVQNFSNFVPPPEQSSSFRRSVTKHSVLQKYSEAGSSSPGPNEVMQTQTVYYSSPYDPINPPLQNIERPPQHVHKQSSESSHALLRETVSPHRLQRVPSTQAQYSGASAVVTGAPNQIMNFKVPPNFQQRSQVFVSPEPANRYVPVGSPGPGQPGLFRSPSNIRPENMLVRQGSSASSFYPGKPRTISGVAKPDLNKSINLPPSKVTVPTRSAGGSPSLKNVLADKTTSETRRNVTVVEKSTTMNFHESKIFKPTLTSAKTSLQAPFVMERAVITEKIVEKPFDVIIEKPVPIIREVKVPINVVIENHVDKVIKRDIITEIIVDKPVDTVREVVHDRIVEVPYERVIDVPVYTEKVVQVPREIVVDKFIDRVIETRTYNDTVVEIDEEEFALIPEGGICSPGVKVIEREISRHDSSPSRENYAAVPTRDQPYGNPNSFKFVGSSKILPNTKSSHFAINKEQQKSFYDSDLNNKCSLSATDLNAIDGSPKAFRPNSASNLGRALSPQHHTTLAPENRNLVAFPVTVQTEYLHTHATAGDEAARRASQNSLFSQGSPTHIHRPDLHSATFSNPPGVSVQYAFPGSPSRQPQGVNFPQQNPHLILSPQPVYLPQHPMPRPGSGHHVQSLSPGAGMAFFTNGNGIPGPNVNLQNYQHHTIIREGEYGAGAQTSVTVNDRMNSNFQARSASEYGSPSYYDRSFASGIATMAIDPSCNQILFSSSSIGPGALNPLLHFHKENISVEQMSSYSGRSASRPQQEQVVASGGFQLHENSEKFKQIDTYSPLKPLTPYQATEIHQIYQVENSNENKIHSAQKQGWEHIENEQNLQQSASKAMFSAGKTPNTVSAEKYKVNTVSYWMLNTPAEDQNHMKGSHFRAHNNCHHQTDHHQNIQASACKAICSAEKFPHTVSAEKYKVNTVSYWLLNTQADEQNNIEGSHFRAHNESHHHDSDHNDHHEDHSDRIEYFSVQRHVEMEHITENPVFKEITIEKPIYIEKVIEKEVIIPVERIINVEVEKVIEVPIDIIVDYPVIHNKVIERERIIERKVPSTVRSPKMSINANLMNESSKLESKIQQMKSELKVLKSSFHQKSQMNNMFAAVGAAKENMA